jgi:hypothetical protein
MFSAMPRNFSREPRALENRLRRLAYRQGLQLARLPKPDPLAVPNPGERFVLFYPKTGQIMSPTLHELDEVDAWLALDMNTRRKRMRGLMSVAG